jgi:diaminopimelate decarboxylase
MSSHFLHRPRPAEVLLMKDDRHRIIRQREDYSILLTNQIFEEDRS